MSLLRQIILSLSSAYICEIQSRLLFKNDEYCFVLFDCLILPSSQGTIAHYLELNKERQLASQVARW